MANSKPFKSAGVFSYLRESREELKKVSWPNRQQVLRYTIIVVAASTAVGLITGAIDYMLAAILEKIV